MTSRPVQEYLAAAVIVILAVTLLAVGTGHAATTPAPLLLVKSNDLAIIALCAHRGSTRCAQQARHGVTLPAFTWTGCGGLSDPLACKRRQVPIETAEGAVWKLAEHHYAGPVVFDIETWTHTPANERANPLVWICRAAKLVKVDPKLQIIITPYTASRGAYSALTHAQQVTMIAEDAKAAQCGAYAVDIQSQWANAQPVTVFQPFVIAAVKAIRKHRGQLVQVTVMRNKQEQVLTMSAGKPKK